MLFETGKICMIEIRTSEIHMIQGPPVFLLKLGCLCVCDFFSSRVFTNFQSIASSQIKEEPEAEAAEEEAEVSEKSVKSDQAEKKTVELATFGTQTEDPEKSPTPPPRTPTPPVVVEVRETQVGQFSRNKVQVF